MEPTKKVKTNDYPVNHDFAGLVDNSNNQEEEDSKTEQVEQPSVQNEEKHGLSAEQNTELLEEYKKLIEYKN